eukprot:3695040-Pyramimonas_sp.AAC.1
MRASPAAQLPGAAAAPGTHGPRGSGGRGDSRWMDEFQPASSGPPDGRGHGQRAAGPGYVLPPQG